MATNCMSRLPWEWKCSRTLYECDLRRRRSPERIEEAVSLNARLPALVGEESDGLAPSSSTASVHNIILACVLSQRDTAGSRFKKYSVTLKRSSRSHTFLDSSTLVSLLIGDEPMVHGGSASKHMRVLANCRSG